MCDSVCDVCAEDNTRLAAAANPARLRTLEREAQREGKSLKRKLQRQRETDQDSDAWGDRPVKREERTYDISQNRVEPKLENDSRGQTVSSLGTRTL